MNSDLRDNSTKNPVKDFNENHSPLPELGEADHLLDQSQLEFVKECIDEDNREDLLRLVDELHKADFADLLECLSKDERLACVKLLDDQFDADILSHLEDDVRDDLVRDFDAKSLANAVESLESDDAVDLVEELEESEKIKLYKFLPSRDRDLIEEALSYPEDSAGRMIHREVVVLPVFWNIGETIDYLRQESKLPDQFYEIYVVDAKFRPVGVLHLNKILCNKRSVKIAEIMSKKYSPIPATTDQEQVADLFRQYGLVSAPVINEQGVLLGEITVDDIFPVIDDEAQEDMFKMAGVTESEIYSAAIETTRSRFSWLFVNLLTAILASIVIAFFEATIEKLVALAILMPIVASMGGNAGTQTLTVAVRALATGKLNHHNAWRIANKEILVGLFNGMIFATVIGIISYIWFVDLTIAWVIGFAMLFNLLIAGLSGFFIPFFLVKLNIDPAVASPVILTTITDVIGFLSFLGLATLVL